MECERGKQVAHNRLIGRVSFVLSVFAFTATTIYTVVELRHLTSYSAGGDAGFAQMGEVLRLILVIAPAGMLVGILLAVIAVFQRARSAQWLLILEVLLFIVYWAYLGWAA